MKTRYFFTLVSILSFVLASATACGGSRDTSSEIAIAVALTQTAAAIGQSQPVQPSPSTATPVPQQATEVPPPTAGPMATPSCDYALQYVADLSYDDQGGTAPPLLQPRQAFRKGWRVQNNGTCAWDTSFSFAFAEGNVPEAKMGGVPIAIARNVTPGEQYDIYAELVAPTTPGQYKGIWQMRDGKGTPFGQRMWVHIEIPSPATPTPPPTQTPVPGIEFWADRTYIKAGERVKFSWKVENVQAVYFYEQGQPARPGSTLPRAVLFICA